MTNKPSNWNLGLGSHVRSYLLIDLLSYLLTWDTGLHEGYLHVSYWKGLCISYWEDCIVKLWKRSWKQMR